MSMISEPPLFCRGATKPHIFKSQITRYHWITYWDATTRVGQGLTPKEAYDDLMAKTNYLRLPRNPENPLTSRPLSNGS